MAEEMHGVASNIPLDRAMVSPMGEVSHWEGKTVLLIPVPSAGHQKQCSGFGGCKFTVKILAGLCKVHVRHSAESQY